MRSPTRSLPPVGASAAHRLGRGLYFESLCLPSLDDSLRCLLDLRSSPKGSALAALVGALAASTACTGSHFALHQRHCRG